MTSHLDALQVRLSNERNYLANAKTEGERELRKVWIAQIEKEIAREIDFETVCFTADLLQMSDDDLLAELIA